MAEDLTRIKSIVESLVFVSEEPLPYNRISKILEGIPTKSLKRAVGELVTEYAESDRGFFLQEVAGGYQFRTKPANAEFIRMLIQEKPQRLSRPAMETLAIVAYRQPIIKPDVDKLRGTDSAGVLQTLLQHRLLKILGRQNAPGKPFIYGTTPEFLEKFGLKDLGALPTLREIEEITGTEIEQTPIDMLEDEVPPDGGAPEDGATEEPAPEAVDPADDVMVGEAPVDDLEPEEPEPGEPEADEPDPDADEVEDDSDGSDDER